MLALGCCMYACAALAVGLTGCLSQTAEVDGSGVSSGGQVQSVHCETNTTLERYLAGSGGIGIKVFDGGNTVVFGGDAEITGESDTSSDLVGAPGEWRLVVDPGGFAGQFKITLSCW